MIAKIAAITNTTTRGTFNSSGNSLKVELTADPEIFPNINILFDL